MKIALIGYGKMGHAVERIALERGHEIVCRIDAGDEQLFDSEAFHTADVAIEFTTPATAERNVRRTLERGVRVVCGSTGWTGALPAIRRYVEEHGPAMIWSSNFSIGVNIFKALNARLAALLGPYADYTASLHEVHHIHKLDHPSGTAVTLAESIIGASPRIDAWAEEVPAADVPHTVAVSHERRGEVPGIHTVTWEGPADSITLTHSARSRDGFALGAVIAAEWLSTRTGWHTVDEALGLSACKDTSTCKDVPPARE